jgi:4-coumarate--CoA ligase (photoactive yellow protein activation family)
MVSRASNTFEFTAAGKNSETESCLHPADAIYADAAACANLLYGRRRLISLVSPHGLLGFVTTVLTPNLQGIPVIDARGMAPEALAASLAFGDVVVATPTLWRYIANEDVKAPDNAMGVSFGEPLAADLAAELRKAGFGALRELYGSTETGLIAWRDSPGEPFILCDHWSRRGANIARNSPVVVANEVEAMDVLCWEGERSFRLGGRRDGAIQVGGVNVFPDRVAATIREHKAIEDCEIRILRHAGGVSRLVAHIKLNAEIAPTEETAREIDAWCRTQLRPPERPRVYHFESSLDF